MYLLGSGAPPAPLGRMGQEDFVPPSAIWAIPAFDSAFNPGGKHCNRGEKQNQEQSSC